MNTTRKGRAIQQQTGTVTRRVALNVGRTGWAEVRP